MPLVELHKTVTPIIATKSDVAKPVGIVTESPIDAGMQLRLYVHHTDGTQIDHPDTVYWTEETVSVDVAEETEITFLLDCELLYSLVGPGNYFLNVRLHGVAEAVDFDTIQAGVLVLQDVLYPGQ